MSAQIQLPRRQVLSQVSSLCSILYYIKEGQEEGTIPHWDRPQPKGSLRSSRIWYIKSILIAHHPEEAPNPETMNQGIVTQFITCSISIFLYLFLILAFIFFGQTAAADDVLEKKKSMTMVQKTLFLISIPKKRRNLLHVTTNNNNNK